MCIESEIQICKKIFLDEVSCYFDKNKAEKGFDETFERAKNHIFSEFQDKEEATEKFTEFVAFFKDTIVNNIDTSKMECVLANSFSY